MNFFSKNKIAFWLLIFLVVINLSALITILVVFPSRIKAPVPEHNRPGAVLHEMLSLSPQQAAGVNVILARYRNLTTPLADSILDRRMKMISEIEKDHPDTVLINNCILDITAFQVKMQQASIRQYMDLKKICTPAQCRILSGIYSEMYGCKEKGQCMGNRMGKGLRRGKGRMNCPQEGRCE
ncbi:MAG: periplasmic heavy metal sensor [Bacteroidota bacterium]|nr:periplasmic heavy metal sensor [Bacteroidota bacterium]